MKGKPYLYLWVFAVALTTAAFGQTDAQLKNPPAGDWLMYRRTYNAWGYSPLNQINTQNISRLRLIWSRAMEPGWNEGTALARGGLVYVPNAGGVVQALNAKTGDLVWEWRPQLSGEKPINYLGQIKRGLALYQDKVYTVTPDNHVLALDARTGRVVWDTDRGQGLDVSYASAPIVANGVVITGSTCQFSGFGCYITGHDAQSGEELWRNSFIPKLGDPGDETWNSTTFESRWMVGAGGQITYDADANVAYFGSTSAGPASPTLRRTQPASGDVTTGGSGSQAGTNTRYAIKPKTGEVLWKQQLLPGDSWNQECTYEMMLINTKLNPKPDAVLAANPNLKTGETRKVLAGVPCRTGIFWNLDAKTGDFVYARSTVIQNMISRIDTKGNVTLNDASILKEMGKVYEVCPSSLGGKDWPPAAYEPSLNAIIVPLNNACAVMSFDTTQPTPLDADAIKAAFKLAPGKTNMGRMEAISVETGKTLWIYEQKAPNSTPVLTTGGGLSFSGGADSRFRAHDSRSGKLLWSTRLPSAVSGGIITFSVESRQYIAVIAGGGLAEGSLSTGLGIDVKTGSNAIFVFALE